jgi:hypothetical protein
MKSPAAIERPVPENGGHMSGRRKKFQAGTVDADSARPRSRVKGLLGHQPASAARNGVAVAAQIA